MDARCNHPTQSKRPRERGLFFAPPLGVTNRRRGLALVFGSLGLVWQGLALANSFEEFFRAIANDNTVAMRGLFLRGFDMNTRNEKNEHPLTLALRIGSLNVADFLISRREVDIESRSAQDESPLMMAALKGHLKQAQALVQRGAHVNKPGWTPLHYAATFAGEQAPALVQLMLDHHAYIDAASPNGSTPLMLAAMYGNPKVVAQLLDAGADATLKNEQGLTALDFAHRAGRPAEAERIAERVRGSVSKGRW